jgi:hypothetical protein
MSTDKIILQNMYGPAHNIMVGHLLKVFPLPPKSIYEKFDSKVINEILDKTEELSNQLFDMPTWNLGHQTFKISDEVRKLILEVFLSTSNTMDPKKRILNNFKLLLSKISNKIPPTLLSELNGIHSIMTRYANDPKKIKPKIIKLMSGWTTNLFKSQEEIDMAHAFINIFWYSDIFHSGIRDLSHLLKLDQEPPVYLGLWADEWNEILGGGWGEGEWGASPVDDDTPADDDSNSNNNSNNDNADEEFSISDETYDQLRRDIVKAYDAVCTLITFELEIGAALVGAACSVIIDHVMGTEAQ